MPETILLTAGAYDLIKRSVPHWPVEIYVRRAEETVRLRRQGALGAPRVVRRRTIPIATGRRTDEGGRFVLTDADRGQIQPQDEVFVRCELRDTACTLKRFQAPHRPYILWLRLANPHTPDFRRNVQAVTRDADELMYPLHVGNDLDTGLTEVASAETAWIAARVFSLLVRMNRWFEGLGTGARPLGHMDVLYPAPEGESYYDGSRIVIGRHDGTSDAVVCHEYGHRIFDKSQPAGYVEPGGRHVWFGRSGGRSPEEQRELDFSEGYATIIGLSFLQTPIFREEHGGGVDVERQRDLASLQGHHGQFGDAPAAGYLWDLVDPEGGPGVTANPEFVSDGFSREFREIHRHFIAWGATLDPHTRRTTARFHRYLKEVAYPEDRVALDFVWIHNFPGADIPGTPAIPGGVPPSAEHRRRRSRTRPGRAG